MAPKTTNNDTLPLIGFGGGCHWCTEAVFQSLNGVEDLSQGFIGSDPPHDTLSEAVTLRFDPTVIPLRILIAAHLATHASTSDHVMRWKYRSAVYIEETTTEKEVVEAIEAISEDTGMNFVTQVLRLCVFQPSDARFHDYYRVDPSRPFCRTYITPKLSRLRAEFAPYYRPIEAN